MSLIMQYVFIGIVLLMDIYEPFINREDQLNARET